MTAYTPGIVDLLLDLFLTSKGGFKSLEILALSRRETLLSNSAPPSMQPQAASLAGIISVASEFLVCASRLLLTIFHKNPSSRIQLKRPYPEDQPEQPSSKRNLASRPMRRTLKNPHPDIHRGIQPIPEFVNVRINGLVSKLTPRTYENGAFSHVIQVPFHTTVEGLSECLLKEQPSTCR